MKKMLAILMILGLVCSSSGLALSATAQQAAPAAATAPAPAAQPAPKPKNVEAGYRGNPESKIYHNSSCRYYKGKSVSKTFASPADAKAAGYRPCKVCKG